MIMDSTSSAFKQQKLEETRDKPWERKNSLIEGVKSKSVGENLLVPSDQGTYWRANWQETEITACQMVQSGFVVVTC